MSTTPEQPLVDLSEVAAEPPGESVARETEVVEQIVEADPYADEPAPVSVEEQLAGLEDPAVLRES
jgi:hypothetical protein